MKRLLFKCVLLLMMFNLSFNVATIYAESNIEELIKNGSFENEDITESFEISNTQGTVSNEYAHTGSNSVKYYDRSANTHGPVWKFTGNETKTYVTSAWIYIPGEQGKSTEYEFNIADNITWNPDRSTDICKKIKYNEWTKLESTLAPERYHAGNKTLSDLRLRVFERIYSGRTADKIIYVDDVSVKRKYYLDSVVISGSDIVSLPQTGTRSSVYTAKALNQNGGTEDMEAELTFSVAPIVPGININSETGELTVSSEAEPGEFIIKCTASEGDTVKMGEKSIFLEQETTDEEKATAAMEALNFSDLTNEKQDCITSDLNLSSLGKYNTSIVWHSNSSAVADDGKVTRTMKKDTEVTLTAEITSGSVTVTKAFNIIVKGVTQFLKNTSFEEPLTNEWKIQGATCTLNITDEEYHTGIKSAYISGRTANWHRINQTVRIPMGEKLICSAWMKLPHEADFIADFTLYAVYNEEYKRVATASVDSNGWAHIVGEYVQDETADEDKEVTFCIFGDNLTDYYMDDFEVSFDNVAAAEINGAEFVRKADSGKINKYDYIVNAVDKLGNSIAPDSVIWKICRLEDGSEYKGVSVDGGVLSVDDSADVGELKIIASVLYNEIYYDAEKTIRVEGFLDEKAAVDAVLDTFTAETVTGNSMGRVYKNLNFPQSCSVSGDVPYTVNFVWNSSDVNIVSCEGIVKRSGKIDIPITITVSASLGEVTEKKSINIIVSRIENFIENGDFENGNTIGWTADGSSVIMADSAVFHGGAYSGVVTGRTDTDTIGFIAVLEKDRIYYIGGYVRSNADKAVINIGNISRLEYTLKNMSFTNINGVFANTDEVPFSINIGVNSADDFWLDSFELYDITEKINSAYSAVEKAEQSRDKMDIENARKYMELLPECERKSILKQRITAIIPKTTEISVGGGGGGGISMSAPKSNDDKTSKTVENISQKKKLSDISMHWAEKDIEYLFENKIVSGDENGKFNPENNITRAEFSKLILCALGKKTVPYSGIYSDIKFDAWYADFVQSISEMGIAGGFDGSFRPEDLITREEMVKLVMNAYDIAYTTGYSEEILGFDDKSKISEWAIPYVAAAVKMKFVFGISDTEFSPKSYSTRAQAAVIIKRLYEKINDTSGGSR